MKYIYFTLLLLLFSTGHDATEETSSLSLLSSIMILIFVAVLRGLGEK